MSRHLYTTLLVPVRDSQDRNTVMAERRFRTLFISDVHLGSKGCQAERLLDFIRHHDAETIYLVGDLVDGWGLRRAGTGRSSTTTCYRSSCARPARVRG